MTYMDHIALWQNRTFDLYLTCTVLDAWFQKVLDDEGSCHPLCKQGSRCYYLRGTMVGIYLVGYVRPQPFT